MQTFTMLTILIRHLSCLRMDLRWLHNNLSGLGVDKLLQLLITFLNSSLENNTQEDGDLSIILSRISMLICQWRAILNEEWRTFQRLSRVRHGWLSYLIALIADSLHLLTQFMSSQGPWLLLAISWILISKKALLVFLTTFLKDFQSSRFLDILYLSKNWLHSSLYYCDNHLSQWQMTAQTSKFLRLDRMWGILQENSTRSLY